MTDANGRVFRRTFLAVVVYLMASGAIVLFVELDAGVGLP